MEKNNLGMIQVLSTEIFKKVTVVLVSSQKISEAEFVEWDCYLMPTSRLILQNNQPCVNKWKWRV
jgi:hypothetical protein